MIACPATFCSPFWVALCVGWGWIVREWIDNARNGGRLRSGWACGVELRAAPGGVRMSAVERGCAFIMSTEHSIHKLGVVLGGRAKQSSALRRRLERKENTERCPRSHSRTHVSSVFFRLGDAIPHFCLGAYAVCFARNSHHAWFSGEGSLSGAATRRLAARAVIPARSAPLAGGSVRHPWSGGCQISGSSQAGPVSNGVEEKAVRFSSCVFQVSTPCCCGSE